MTSHLLFGRRSSSDFRFFLVTDAEKSVIDVCLSEKTFHTTSCAILSALWRGKNGEEKLVVFLVVRFCKENEPERKKIEREKEERRIDIPIPIYMCRKNSVRWEMYV